MSKDQTVLAKLQQQALDDLIALADKYEDLIEVTNCLPIDLARIIPEALLVRRVHLAGLFRKHLEIEVCGLEMIGSGEERLHRLTLSITSDVREALMHFLDFSKEYCIGKKVHMELEQKKVDE